MAATRFEIPIEYATVRPDVRATGHVQAGIGPNHWTRRPFPDDRMETFTFRAQYLAYLMAGLLAEQRIVDDYTERPATAQGVRYWFEAEGGSDYRQAATMVNAVSYWPRADSLLMAAFREAEKVVTEDRHAIRTLARELQQWERLSVREIRPIVLGAMRAEVASLEQLRAHAID